MPWIGLHLIAFHVNKLSSECEQVSIELEKLEFDLTASIEESPGQVRIEIN